MAHEAESHQYPAQPYHILNRGGAGPIDAGFGLVHADTLVATCDDEFRVAPENAGLLLRVGGKQTSGPVAALACGPGTHAAHLRVTAGTQALVDKDIKLILVEPSQLCRRFGARYGSLEYDRPVITGPSREKNSAIRSVPWASLWKTGDVADITVDFDAPYKLVLWRGMSYTPSWAMNNIMTSNYFAETVEPGLFRDCCEMMSDRECRYSHARVIHSSAARVVIHWRYALNDSAYAICRNQWVDEMLYVYPDGVMVRNVTLYLDSRDETAWVVCPRTGRRVPCSMINGQAGKRTFNDMEFITVNAPGATSDDNTPPEALTIMDGERYSLSCCWPKPPDLDKEPLPALNETIFKMNYHHRPGVFIASPSAGLQVSLQGNAGLRYEAGTLVQDDQWVRVPDLPGRFADHIHWPITRGYGTTPLTDPSAYLDRPTHTFLGFANNAPVDVREDGAVTWTWLSGMAPENEGALRARVRAWTAPAAIKGAEYHAREGTYRVADVTGDMVLDVAPNRQVIRPTLVLPGCETNRFQVLVNGGCLPDASVSVGLERTLASVQTVITLTEPLPAGSKVEIKIV